MEAMTSGPVQAELIGIVRRPSRVSQLWQLPLLIVSVALFCYAAYLFIDARPGLTIGEKIELGRKYMKADRPEAAVEHFNKLLASEKLENGNEATVHLLIAASIEQAQKQKHITIPANYQSIIDQTQIALSQGAKPNAVIHQRLAESFEAIGKPGEALSNYRLAMAMDNELAIRLQKKVVEMQVANDEAGAAGESLEKYLKSAQISGSERAWAMGMQAQILIDRSDFLPARAMLREALKLELDPVAQGEINYRLGYAAWKMEENEEAERCLRVARDELKSRHPLDGEACYVLGRIYQDKNEPEQAIAYYQEVLVNHPESRVAPGARLGRGVCRIAMGDDDAGLTDLHDLTGEVGQRTSRSRFKGPAIDGLKKAATLLEAKGNYQGALEAMEYEQELQPAPPASFLGRLGRVYESRAEQVEAGMADAKEAERVKRGQQIYEFRTKAGDAYIAYSRALTLADDKGYGDALWKGIDLYDRAGDMQQTIAALKLFVEERGGDSLAPEALLRLGRAYQAAGRFDEAIKAYQTNQFRYPQSLAASQSAVPLAQAYIAKGPDSYAKAESVLKGLVENNPLITPTSSEFKEALFELGQLYYRTNRFDEAIGRLDEWVARYPKDAKLGQVTFVTADSYRKSAGQLEAHLAAAKTGASGAETPDGIAERKKRLTQARGLYQKVTELYHTYPPQRDLDKLYQKLAYFYRADCEYDLGNYAESINLYDQAALLYQDDAAALAAYVQIVNANCALGHREEAKKANERAMWLIRRMPMEAFPEGSFSMPKEYWQQWLKWTSQSGMFQ
jgi:tetratricopeptide (TPR) repeat protein